VDDRQLHSGPPQRAAAANAAKMPGMERAIQARAAFGHGDVDESEPEFRAGDARHDRAGRGDFAGGAAADESRGAHYKPAFPKRNDEEFLKATIAEYDPAGDCPRMSYGPVDISLVPPRAREYGKKADSPAAVPAGREKAMA